MRCIRYVIQHNDVHDMGLHVYDVVHESMPCTLPQYAHFVTVRRALTHIIATRHRKTNQQIKTKMFRDFASSKFLVICMGWIPEKKGNLRIVRPEDFLVLGVTSRHVRNTGCATLNFSSRRRRGGRGVMSNASASSNITNMICDTMIYYNIL